MRAAAGASVGCVAEVVKSSEEAFSVPFAEDANVPALIALVSKTAATLVPAGSGSVRQPEVTIRENELRVLCPYTPELAEEVKKLIAVENDNPSSRLLLAPRPASHARTITDPEFQRILDRE
jgi:hypothetical protein